MIFISKTPLALVIFCIFAVTALADPGSTPTPHSGSQLEFEGTVVEGVGNGMSGVTAVRTKQNSGSLYSKQMDFGAKIRDSVNEMPHFKLSNTSGGQ